MPNIVVPASGEAMPAVSLERAAIMNTAWANYRRWHSVRESIHGTRKFDRKEFAFKLQIAWRDAKLAALTPLQCRTAAIRTEIDGLKYKPMRIRLEAELRVLAA